MVYIMTRRRRLHHAIPALMISLLAFQGYHNQVSSFAIPEPIIHFTLGAVAGGAGTFASYPLDYIKSQMQTESGSQKYDNGMDAFVDTVQQNPLQLYKGVGVQVIGTAPEKGIKLGVNDMCASTFVSTLGCFPLWAQVLSGGLAGACQVLASSPVEVLKVGLQTSDRDFQEVWEEVGGLKGLFRGADVCLLRDVLFTIICFPLYTFWVQSSVPAFVAGAMSGVIASFITTPPDAIKTRIISQEKPMRIPGEAISVPDTGSFVFAYNSTLAMVAPYQATSPTATTMFTQEFGSDDDNPWKVARNMIEREGAGALFSGVTERCLGAIPRFGTTLAMHDYLEQVASHAGWFSHGIS